MSQQPPSPQETAEIQELYKLTMADIEPDLLLEHLDKLSEKYAQQTPEEKAERMKKYAEAFDECFKRMDMVLTQMKEDVHAFKNTIMERWAQKEKAESDSALISIEASLNQL